MTFYNIEACSSDGGPPDSRLDIITNRTCSGIRQCWRYTQIRFWWGTLVARTINDTYTIAVHVYRYAIFVTMYVAFSSWSSAISQLFATFSLRQGFHAVSRINLRDAAMGEDSNLNDGEINLSLGITVGHGYIFVRPVWFLFVLIKCDASRWIV